MSIASTRSVALTFTGDEAVQETLSAANNAAAIGPAPLFLASGVNTISVPTGSTGLSLRKPAGNTVQVTLKGVSGDTGIQLGLTDPDSFSLAVGQTSVVLVAASAVELLAFWS